MKCASIILSIVLSVMAVCQVRAADIEEKKITITAHRGGAALAPENTLAAVRLGMELGVDYIEIDIHQTADNQLVVCHDMTIDRTTNGRGKICNMTLDEIRSFNIVYCDSVTDLKIPTLDEVLALVDGKTKLLIEIKKK